MISGRLKRTMKERCPECGKVLQIRAVEKESVKDGEIITIEEEYICCSNKSCDYEETIKEKKRR